MKNPFSHSRTQRHTLVAHIRTVAVENGSEFSQFRCSNLVAPKEVKWHGGMEVGAVGNETG